MIYALFLVLAILFNIRKFSKEKGEFLRSIIEATSSEHRDMILSYHFHVFIFEAFLAVIVSHLISKGGMDLGLLGLAAIYLVLLFFGLIFYQSFLKFLERTIGMSLRSSFNQHLIKEFRVSFALIMLPILLYTLLNWTFKEETDAAHFSFLAFFTNTIFVSVLTITCTVIIMLRLIPNREIVEPEYLEIIQKRLSQIGMPKMRIRWIETDIKNAFVVGLTLLRFSNQTMFIGKKLRTLLTLEEFDAVIAHELAHVANRHVHKRVIELVKNSISLMIGTLLLIAVVIGAFLIYFQDDMPLHYKSAGAASVVVCLSWFFFNYALFFDAIRSHEFEADAYAVMVMGAGYSALKSSLQKLTINDGPDYLKLRTVKKSSNVFSHWFKKTFSTHPEIEERLSSLRSKIDHQLPFNHYVSTSQKVRRQLGWFVQWKVSVPLTAVFVALITWSSLTIRSGRKLVAFIKHSTPEAIIKHPEIAKKINDKPFILGTTLMYQIVKRQDPALIDHFLRQGADPARTLNYICEFKNYPLFEAYYKKFEDRLTEDEYYLIMMISSRANFVEGYRLLVNSPRFEVLDSDYKANVAGNHKKTGFPQRKPASH